MNLGKRSSASALFNITAATLVCAGLVATGDLAGPSAASAAQLGNPALYRSWMVDARKLYPYPQSVDKMYRVMLCESGGNARASGGGGAWLGLFQYAPRTWRGAWNPYRASSIWDARSQIYATAKAWRLGMQRQWSCYFKTAGK